MKRRILISLGLLLAICLVGDVTAMVCLWRSTHDLASLAESHRIQALRADLASAGVRVELDLLSLFAGHAHTSEERAANVQRFQRSLRRCSTCHHPPHLVAEFDDLRNYLDSYRATLTDLYESPDPRRAYTLRDEAMRLADSFVEKTTELSDRADKHLMASSAEVSSNINRAWAVLVATLLILLIAGGVVASHLMGRLTKPVEALLEGVQRARAGDANPRFSVRADREFRVLADAFNTAYKELSTAKDSIMQAEKLAAVGKLAAGVAHEVLNPLASISSIAQLMRRHCGSEEQARQLELIITETTRISKVLRELLTFSRPVKPEEHGPVEIGPMLEHAVRLMRYDHRAIRIGIELRLDPNLPQAVGDSQRLLLVFTNIIINAIDAMSATGDGSGNLTISARNETGPVTVTFEDSGPGMTEDQLTHAFEPFFTTKEPGAGTGLGLWICYQVVQRHRGKIRLASRLGEGSTVTVELPSDAPKADDPDS